MRFNFIYILAFICLIAALPFIKKSIVTSNEFYGLAENQVRSVNLEFPIEIIHAYKSMGEPVQIGDTILRYKRLDVVAKQQILAYEREQTLKQIQADQQHSKGELDLLQNKKAQIKRQYKQQYDELEKADQENQNLLRQLAPNSTLPGSAKSKYRIELEALKLKEIMDIRELDIRIENVKKGAKAKVSEQGIESAKLEYEAQTLSALEKDHFICAATEGIIGQMEFAAGDKVEKYVTLLKIYGTRPNMVTTYIGDGQLSQIGTGDSVQIISLNDATYQLKGVVHSMGTRITALPERLKKVPELRAWGREIQITIPENNTLLQGEKVRVKL